MTFQPGFVRAHVPAFGPLVSTTAAAPSWWLSGGIAAANCIVAHQFDGASSYAAGKSNLANPGVYTAADGVAFPTWDAANGAKFAAASSQYLTCGATPGDDWSMILSYTNAAAAPGFFAGCYINADAALALQVNTTTMRAWHGKTSSFSPLTAPLLTSGTYAVCGKTVYRNGAADGTVCAAGSGTNYTTLAIGGLLQNGSYTQFYSFYLKKFALYNISIDAYIAALSAAM